MEKCWIEWLGRLWVSAVLLACYIALSDFKMHFMIWLTAAILIIWVTRVMPELKWKRKL